MNFHDLMYKGIPLRNYPPQPFEVTGILGGTFNAAQIADLILQRMTSAGVPQDNWLAFRPDTMNQYPKLALVPKGNPTQWKYLWQGFANDVIADPANCECLEWTCEVLGAPFGNKPVHFLNTFALGTGIVRDFAIMVNGLGGCLMYWIQAALGYQHWRFNFKAGLPVPADIPQGYAGFWYDTATSAAYIACNNMGTIQKVQMT